MKTSQVVASNNSEENLEDFCRILCRGFLPVLRIFADVLAGPRCLVASRWKLCSEGEISFAFSENISHALYPENFCVLKIFP